VSRPVCQGSRKDGTPCRAPALPDSALCWVHDPRQAETAARARAAGASKGAKVKALKSQRRRIDTHAGMAVFLAGVIHDVVEGKLDTDTARAVMYGCSVMRHLADHEVERRLAEVERKLDSATARRA
jgi:hypothetical protein